MTTNTRRLTTVAMALTMLALVAGNATAQCCGATTAYYSPGYTNAYYAPTYTAAYAPAYTSYYSGGYSSYYAPSAYTTYYSGGWYPGYWADRVRTRLWGSPTGYVAAHPTSYAASYAPYTASYAPSTCASCQTGYVTSYAPACSSCSTCASPCSTCASYEPCSSCSTCTAGYAPAHQQPSCCAATTYSQPAAQSQQVVPQQQQQQTAPLTPEPRPTLDTTQQPQAQSSTTNRPVETTTAPPQQPAQPASSHPEYDVKKSDNSTYLEAPKLFSPQDRTAKRSIAPVHNALYKQPASYHQVSTAKTVVTAEQAHKDAIGWTSASK